jgi:hypothetical protein
LGAHYGPGTPEALAFALPHHRSGPSVCIKTGMAKNGPGNRPKGDTKLKAFAACVFAFALLALALPASPAKSQTGAAAPGASQTPAAPAAAPKALTPQRQRMKDCGVKWKEEKANTGAKGRVAYNKFMRGCLKKPAA